MRARGNCIRRVYVEDGFGCRNWNAGHLSRGPVHIHMNIITLASDTD